MTDAYIGDLGAVMLAQSVSTAAYIVAALLFILALAGLSKQEIRQMEDEIAYRAALIHEVHHRVKNNLQTIISLVGLEAAQKKDAEFRNSEK